MRNLLKELIQKQSNVPNKAVSLDGKMLVHFPRLNSTFGVKTHAKLQILRAILEKSKRCWESVWRGVKISGPVLDAKFYEDFFAHKITIAPGDALKVVMKIYQTRIPDIGIYTNDKYEIIEVLEHIPKLKQTDIDLKSI